MLYIHLDEVSHDTPNLNISICSVLVSLCVIFFFIDNYLVLWPVLSSPGFMVLCFPGAPYKRERNLLFSLDNGDQVLLL